MGCIALGPVHPRLVLPIKTERPDPRRDRGASATLLTSMTYECAPPFPCSVSRMDIHTHIVHMGVVERSVMMQILDAIPVFVKVCSPL